MHVEREFTCEVTAENYLKVSEMVEECMTEAEFGLGAINKLLLSVDEIYANIKDYSEAKTCTIKCIADGKKIELDFTDDGLPFDPTSKPEPDVLEDLMERNIGGLGIFIVRKLMDTVDYRRENDKNLLIIQKEFR